MQAEAAGLQPLGGCHATALLTVPQICQQMASCAEHTPPGAMGVLGVQGCDDTCSRKPQTLRGSLAACT